MSLSWPPDKTPNYPQDTFTWSSPKHLKLSYLTWNRDLSSLTPASHPPPEVVPWHLLSQGPGCYARYLTILPFSPSPPLPKQLGVLSPFLVALTLPTSQAPLPFPTPRFPGYHSCSPGLLKQPPNHFHHSISPLQPPIPQCSKANIELHCSAHNPPLTPCCPQYIDQVSWSLCPELFTVPSTSSATYSPYIRFRSTKVVISEPLEHWAAPEFCPFDLPFVWSLHLSHSSSLANSYLSQGQLRCHQPWEAFCALSCLHTTKSGCYLDPPSWPLSW